MFLNATAFPLCKEIDNRWKRNCVSRGSYVTPEILLPSFVINSKANSFQAPPVTITIGTKWCVLARSVYFVVLFSAALSAAAVALVIIIIIIIIII